MIILITKLVVPDGAALVRSSTEIMEVSRVSYIQRFCCMWSSSRGFVAAMGRSRWCLLMLYVDTGPLDLAQEPGLSSWPNNLGLFVGSGYNLVGDWIRSFCRVF